MIKKILELVAEAPLPPSKKPKISLEMNEVKFYISQLTI